MPKSRRPKTGSRIPITMAAGFRKFVKLRLFMTCRVPFPALILLGILACAGARSQSTLPALPLHTAGASIVDAHGERVHLRAVNWYGAESSDFVVAGLHRARLESIAALIRAQGFNAVRLPWSNQLLESNPGVDARLVAANPELAGLHAMEIYDRVVSALTKAGIMVIPDNHNSDAEWCCDNDDGNTLWYNQRYPQSRWLADWRAMAARYKSNPLVVGVDLRNEPRFNAVWGGPDETNWQKAAVLGGNAVLEVNPHLLIFVEGIDYALDLRGARALPVILKIPHKLVYEAHDYSYDYKDLADSRDYARRVTAKWGYLRQGKNPTPVWLGEFGVCNTRPGCVASNKPGEMGRWFGFLSEYVRTNQIDWAYWAVNGTQAGGAHRQAGAPEGYGILNPAWNGSALPELTRALQALNQGTGNREQGTGNREQGTGNREQGTGNREQGTGNREQGTGNFSYHLRSKDARCVMEGFVFSPRFTNSSSLVPRPCSLVHCPCPLVSLTGFRAD
jgi:endoglucanase